MGEVWEGEQEDLCRRVAVKVLPAAAWTSEEARTRFHREAEAGARLAHPGIVTVFTYGEDDGIPFIVQELVEGGSTLADFVRNAREDAAELPKDYPLLIAELFADIAEALQYAHDHGVVHRDVKPQNVLIDPEGRPKVADFGLARIASEEPVSRSGELIGTYYYMSPEQARGKRTDHRTDIFSLGATLYEALTLHRPFQGDSSHDVLRRILLADPPPPESVAAVPRDLSTICRKALAKEPEDRYESMGAMAADLRRFLRGEPVHARPLGLARRARSWVRRRPGPIGVGVALLVAALFTGVFAVRNADAREAIVRMEREKLFVRAEHALSFGDLDEVEVLLEQAARLEPRDGFAHLKMAAAYACYQRFTDARDQIAKARAIGLDSSLIGDSPLGWLAEACEVMATDGPQGAARAVELLEHALEVDPDLVEAWFPLYIARRVDGDEKGALEALIAFGRLLRNGDPMAETIRALELELLGQPERAYERLGAASAKLDPASFERLRLPRTLGRIAIGAGRYADAEEWLVRAVESSPRDIWSVDNLVGVLHRRAMRSDLAERAAILAEVERHAHVAVARNPLAAHNSLRALALGSLRFVDDSSPEAIDASLGATREALARLEQALPDDPLCRILSAHVAAVRADLESDPAVREEGLRQALEIAPEYLPAQVRLAQTLWGRGRDGEMHELFEIALETWDASQAHFGERPFATTWEPKWHRATVVWLFDAAVRAGVSERAAEVRELVEAALANDGDAWAADEIGNYVEFLATCPDVALRDCERARELIATYDLRERLTGVAGGPELLASVDSNCD